MTVSMLNVLLYLPNETQEKLESLQLTIQVQYLIFHSTGLIFHEKFWNPNEANH